MDKEEVLVYEAPSAELIPLEKPMNILATLSVTGEFEDFEIGDDLD